MTVPSNSLEFTATASMPPSESAQPRLVGIFGTGRNGSTLLTRLLDGISDAYVHPVETTLLSAINDLSFREYVSEDVIKNVATHPLQRLDRPVATERLKRYFLYHQKEIEADLLPVVDAIELGPSPFDAIDQRPSWTAHDFAFSFFNAFAGWLQPGPTPKLVIFKSIETPYIPYYERLFPQMRFVHIMRDPVEMWASQKRSLMINKRVPAWYLGMDNLSACIDRRWVPHATVVAERMGSSCHFVLRYEDLVREPTSVMAGLTSWLGVVSSEPTMQTVLGGRAPRKMLRYSSQPGVETPREVVADLKKRHGYIEVVSDRERNLIRLATWPLAGKLGYGIDEQRPDPGSVRAAWNAIDRDEFSNSDGFRSQLLNTVSFLKRRLYVRRVCREASR